MYFSLHYFYFDYSTRSSSKLLLKQTNIVMNKSSLIVLLCLAAITSSTSCKSEKSGNTTLSVRLHDDPIDADSAFVEILEVRIHSENEGWITLNAQAGIYDLLQLQNGIDTLLVPPQEIPSGLVSQIRFILGDENSIVIDDTTYPLELNSQDESGLKLNLHEELNSDQTYTIVVDFDAGESILQNGNGTYKLKPVLRAELQ